MVLLKKITHIHEFKDMISHSKLLAGNIQILNMSTGTVERDFATHTFPIRGIGN